MWSLVRAVRLRRRRYREDNICACMHAPHFNELHIIVIKAKISKISSDTHPLKLIKLHHFKLEIFKSI